MKTVLVLESSRVQTTAPLFALKRHSVDCAHVCGCVCVCHKGSGAAVSLRCEAPSGLSLASSLLFNRPEFKVTTQHQNTLNHIYLYIYLSIYRL